MIEHLEQDMGENIPSPTDLIDNSMELSVWSMGDKPSLWNSVIYLLDEYNKVNGNWAKEEHNVVKRFLKGFAEETFVIDELPRHQKITINWLLSNGGEDIGQPSEEEKELVKKWVGKFQSAKG